MIENIELDEPGQGQDQGRQNPEPQRGGNQPRRDDQKEKDQRPKQGEPGQGKRPGQGGEDEEN